MLVAWLAVLVAIVGLLLYLLPVPPKVSDIGRIMFACGLLVTLWLAGGRSVHIP